MVCCLAWVMIQEFLVTKGQVWKHQTINKCYNNENKNMDNKTTVDKKLLVDIRLVELKFTLEVPQCGKSLHLLILKLGLQEDQS